MKLTPQSFTKHYRASYNLGTQWINSPWQTSREEAQKFISTWLELGFDYEMRIEVNRTNIFTVTQP